MDFRRFFSQPASASTFFDVQPQELQDGSLGPLGADPKSFLEENLPGVSGSKPDTGLISGCGCSSCGCAGCSCASPSVIQETGRLFESLSEFRNSTRVALSRFFTK